MSTDLTVVKFNTVVNSPESRQESSRVSSCSCHDQSTDHRYPVKYRSDGYETSVQEGPALIPRLLMEGAKVIFRHNNQGMCGKERGRIKYICFRLPFRIISLSFFWDWNNYPAKSSDIPEVTLKDGCSKVILLWYLAVLEVLVNCTQTL